VGWLEAGDARYSRLNDIIRITEGLIGEDEMQIRVYAGVVELKPWLTRAATARSVLPSGSVTGGRSRSVNRRPGTPFPDESSTQPARR